MLKKSNKLHTFSLALLLASSSFLSPVAHGAANPAGQTINSMAATTTDLVLQNYGTILDGELYSVAGYYRIAMYGNSTSAASFSFSNFGDITINNATGHSYGMFARSDSGSHTLTNNGTINLNSLLYNTLRGMYAWGNGSHTLTNNGAIILSGSGRELLSGLYAYGGDQQTLTNNGTIIINASKASHGMYSDTMHSNASANLHNSGYISVKGDNQEMFGMRGANQTLNISNTGVINVWADAGIASEALVFEGNLNVGTWATTLRDFSINDNVFGLAAYGASDMGYINFDNNKLILRPGTSAQGFELGKTYKVSDMIKVLEGGWENSNEIPVTADHVKGNIAEAIAEVPFLKATLENGSDPFNATVRLDSNISASTTPGTIIMGQAVAQVQGQFNNLSTSLRNTLVDIYTGANLATGAGQKNARNVSAGSEFMPNNKWQTFITPYANAVNNSEINYDGYNMGITAGATYRVSDNFFFGGHLDFSSANYDGDLMNMNTESTSLAFGLHAAINFIPQWYLRGQLTTSKNQNDSDYKVDLNLHGDADFNGDALYAELATGYTWEIAKGHSITPEIGISHLNLHTSAYDINFSNSIYNMNHDDSYYDALYATAYVDWRSEWELKNNSNIAVLAGLGLRQTLSNGEIETDFTITGSQYSAITTEDSTTFLADVGVEYRKDNYSISLNYDGAYGSSQTSHGGNIMMKLDF